jgi:hypothetical protein
MPVCGELLIFDTNQQFATHRMKILDRDGHALERARLAAAASVLRLGSLGLFQRSIKIGVGECVDLRLELLASCDDGFEKLDRRKKRAS